MDINLANKIAEKIAAGMAPQDAVNAVTREVEEAKNAAVVADEARLKEIEAGLNKLINEVVTVCDRSKLTFDFSSDNGEVYFEYDGEYEGWNGSYC